MAPRIPARAKPRCDSDANRRRVGLNSIFPLQLSIMTFSFRYCDREIERSARMYTIFRCSRKHFFHTRRVSHPRTNHKAWVPHPSRTLRRVGYENLTQPSIFHLNFCGEGFVVSHPFVKKAGERMGTQFGWTVWGPVPPVIPFNSCRSRCYPKFQAHTRLRWIKARQRDLLPTNYFELPAESHATDEPHNQHNHNNCS